MVAGVNRFKDDCEADSLIHNRCAGHVFDMAITDGLRIKEIQSSITKIRFYCSKIHRSPKFTQDLHFQCIACEEPSIQVVMDVDTRWNSTYDMLATALRIKKALTAMSSSISSKLKNDEKMDPLNAQDWNVVNIVTELLYPFYQGIFIYYVKHF